MNALIQKLAAAAHCSDRRAILFHSRAVRHGRSARGYTSGGRSVRIHDLFGSLKAGMEAMIKADSAEFSWRSARRPPAAPSSSGYGRRVFQPEHACPLPARRWRKGVSKSCGVLTIMTSRSCARRVSSSLHHFRVGAGNGRRALGRAVGDGDQFRTRQIRRALLSHEAGADETDGIASVPHQNAEPS